MLTVLFLVIVMFMPLADPLTKLMRFQFTPKSIPVPHSCKMNARQKTALRTVLITMQKQLEMRIL